MAPADAARAIPILPSPNLAETSAFYTGQLGFAATLYEKQRYLIVRRGEMEIHFWHSDDRKLPEVSSCYIRGGEIEALHAEFAARNVHRLSEFTLRPWHMKEFYVWDPHGNLLRFGCEPAQH
ncbi:MAG: VOC family protein [Rhizobiaceae bacterium]|nr:VOC family protein [Rhizobiaceae bacterium]